MLHEVSPPGGTRNRTRRAWNRFNAKSTRGRRCRRRGRFPISGASSRSNRTGAPSARSSLRDQRSTGTVDRSAKGGGNVWRRRWSFDFFSLLGIGRARVSCAECRFLPQATSLTSIRGRGRGRSEKNVWCPNFLSFFSNFLNVSLNRRIYIARN